QDWRAEGEIEDRKGGTEGQAWKKEEEARPAQRGSSCCKDAGHNLLFFFLNNPIVYHISISPGEFRANKEYRKA
ncbi:964_t:CDS:1, partial [Acaulospora colombiana]